jgi:hypothetical protein
MPHQINSMFYNGEVPWHKLGTRLDHPATAEEAIQAAGLDYTVAKRPMKAIIHGHRYSDVPDHFATVRMDTGDVLGVVGNRYQPIQNQTALSFFDPLVGADEAVYETAGALGKGERIWILAKLPGYIKVRGKDIVNKYLLLDYVKSLIPDNEEAEKNTRTENIRKAILDLHESGQGAELCRGTLWGAYNAVTEYTDHLMHGANPDKRLNSIWFGGGERLKLKAYQSAESLLN